MNYTRQYFEKGQILTAEKMNKVDKWLAHICGKEIVSSEINVDGELELVFKDGERLCLGAVGGTSTEADIDEIVNQVLLALPTWNGGSY